MNMHHQNWRGNYWTRNIICTLLGLVVVFIVQMDTASAESMNLPEALQGPAFSDPGKKTEISDSNWLKQKVQHPPGFKNPDILASLDQHLYNAIAPMIKTYANEHGLHIALQEGTCGITSGMLTAKQADVGGYCCTPATSDRLPGLTFHTIGLASIAIIVHPDNPVNNVTMAEVRRLFSGDIDNWNQLSDHNAKSYNRPIQPITRLHCKLRPGNWRVILDNEDLFSPNIQDVPSISDMVDSVAGLPTAVGWVTRWILDRDPSGKRVKILSIDGARPEDMTALAQERYPFFRTLNLTLWQGTAANPQAQQLVQHLLQQLDQKKLNSHVVPVDRLRANGWRFLDDELIGKPSK
jgi:phosphate transport system substrate-binding protein